MLLLAFCATSAVPVDTVTSSEGTTLERRRYLNGEQKGPKSKTKAPKKKKAHKKTKSPKKTKAPKKTKSPKKTKEPGEPGPKDKKGKRIRQ